VAESLKQNKTENLELEALKIDVQASSEQIQGKASTVQLESNEGLNQSVIIDSDDKQRTMEQKNLLLENTIKSLYEKDDLFMESSRRENEEKENTIKLLQAEVEKLNNEKYLKNS
jgi:replication fork clamp-binding protein CrfC